jgi:hypothetical protein
MTRFYARLIAGLALAMALAPALAGAQGRVATFDPLPDKLRVGQTVIVTDQSGAKAKGEVIAISPTSLTVRTRSQTQTFQPATVTKVQRPGPIWDGAVKGAAVAFGVILLAGGAHYPEVFLPITGIGAGIGLGVDAAFGPKTLYKAPSSTRAVVVAPLVGGGQRGARVVISF